ncbi:ran GTPase-activating protein 1 [Macrosteles quadrilineatus]|uniref:ran GTPase-activating protein 1 n=1 Tax=Macrosteles quadrilineatus TaxID=74068 RepID=UPI0023E0ABBB|nr:ran GTPase-activating protein 1 [Macrosteles quadrilineatus]
MSLDPLDDLTNKLSNTKVTGEGVSFVGKSLKLNNADDAKVVTDAIAACQNLEYLNLEGNTLGVDAAKAIGTALGTHPELKRALWKDMFTGRMKDEIPQALRYLGSGLDMANVRLVELDLSDNAFGPIGMEGLASLLRSSSCHSLQELRLNNNGLGITGAKLLSKALMDCYESSKAEGKPLPLRVFIAGRNRLENEGVTALAKVFKVIGTLEEIQIPQNGIYHVGIRELSEALKSNPGLQVLNLNDNTLGPKGATALASALSSLQLLRDINLGDCLLKTAGALSIADGLREKHANLVELKLDHNEIKKDGGLAIAKAMENKTKLKVLNLNGNQFGETGVFAIKDQVRKNKKPDVLDSFSEDEDEDEEEEEDNENSDEEEEEENEEDSYVEENQKEQNNKSEKELTNGIKKELTSQSSLSSVETEMLNLLKNVTAADFLQSPSPVMFLALRANKSQQIMDEIQVGTVDGYLERFVGAVMKVSSLCTEPTVAEEAGLVCNTLYKELFSWAQAHNQLSLVNNSLLVHVGLLKGEDKKWRASYNLTACRIALDSAMSQNYFPQESKDTIRYFLEKKPQVIVNKTLL